MIGVLMVNERGEVCFIDSNNNCQNIESFVYTAESKIAAIQLVDGSSEVITKEIEDVMHQCPSTQSNILVVQLNLDGQVSKEITVPLKLN